MDDLIQNNYNQFVINSKLFKEIKTLSENLQTILSNQEFPFRKHRLRILTYDLMNLMDTITLAKRDCLCLTEVDTSGSHRGTRG